MTEETKRILQMLVEDLDEMQDEEEDFDRWDVYSIIKGHIKLMIKVL